MSPRLSTKKKKKKKKRNGQTESDQSMFINLFSSLLMLHRNKLDCLLPTSIFNPVQYILLKFGAYPGGALAINGLKKYLSVTDALS